MSINNVIIYKSWKFFIHPLTMYSLQSFLKLFTKVQRIYKTLISDIYNLMQLSFHPFTPCNFVTHSVRHHSHAELAMYLFFLPVPWCLIQWPAVSETAYSLGKSKCLHFARGVLYADVSWWLISAWIGEKFVPLDLGSIDKKCYNWTDWLSLLSPLL